MPRASSQVGADGIGPDSTASHRAETRWRPSAATIDMRTPTLNNFRTRSMLADSKDRNGERGGSRFGNLPGLKRKQEVEREHQDAGGKAHRGSGGGQTKKETLKGGPSQKVASYVRKALSTKGRNFARQQVDGTWRRERGPRALTTSPRG